MPSPGTPLNYTWVPLYRGMYRDVPRFQIPEGGVYTADNVLADQPGLLRKRGGNASAHANTSTALDLYQTAVLSSSSEDGTYIVYASTGGGTGSMTAITSGGTLRVNTDYVTNLSTGGSPANHFNWVVFPFVSSNTGHARTIVAGSNFALAGFSNTTALTLTTGSRTITGFTVGDIAHAAVGMIFVGSNAGLTKMAAYRIVSVDAAGHTITVEPNVSDGFVTSGNWTLNSVWVPGDAIANGFAGAARVTSYQNRLVYGDCLYLRSGSVYQRIPNRLSWSVLPTETPVASGVSYSGQVEMFDNGVLPNNFVDIQDVGKIMAIRPVGEGQLFIMGDRACAKLVGDLTSQTSTAGGFTFSIQTIPGRNIGCVSEVGVQSTPYGVIFPSWDGVYLYDGSRLTNLMQNKIATNLYPTYTLSLFGSAYFRNHYFLSTSVGAIGNGVFVLNLLTGEWTTFSGSGVLFRGTSAFDAPTGNAYACSQTTGTTTHKLVRTDYYFNPAVTTDVDGANVRVVIQGPAVAVGSPARLKGFRHVKAVCNTATQMVAQVSAGLDGNAGAVAFPGVVVDDTGFDRIQVVRSDTVVPILSQAICPDFAQINLPSVRENCYGWEIGYDLEDPRRTSGTAG